MPTAPPAAAPSASATGAPPTPYRHQRQRLYDEMVRLAAAGWSKAAIARQVGLSIPTVRAYLLAGGPPDLTARGPKPGACRGDHQAYLRERWRAGCRDAKALWQELREDGYRGSLRTVQRPVAPWRAPGEPRRGRRPATLPPAPLPPPRPPSPRRVRWWLLRPPEERTPTQTTFLAELLARCPEIATAQGLARDFLALLRERNPAALDGWLERAAGGADDRLEQRAGRGARRQAGARQARDVRARGLPAPAAARAPRGVMGDGGCDPVLTSRGWRSPGRVARRRGGGLPGV